MPSRGIAMSEYRRDQRALYLCNEERYGLRRLVATVVFVTPDGLRTPSFSQFDRVTELADLEISAHISTDMVGAYGFTVAYAPHQVQRAQAVTMARVLRRVDRDLDAARARFGYPTDFHSYLTQVAFVLGINRFVIAAPDGQTFPTGERHRHADAAGVQMWIADQVKQYTKLVDRSET